MFDSSILQIIIQYKWDTIVKSIFKTGFHVYCVYLAIFTTLCLKFQDWILEVYAIPAWDLGFLEKGWRATAS